MTPDAPQKQCTVWIAISRTREGASGFGVIGVYQTSDLARKGVSEYVTKHYHPEIIVSCVKSFGGDPANGSFYSEEESIEISHFEVIGSSFKEVPQDVYTYHVPVMERQGRDDHSRTL